MEIATLFGNKKVCLLRGTQGLFSPKSMGTVYKKGTAPLEGKSLLRKQEVIVPIRGAVTARFVQGRLQQGVRAFFLLVPRGASRAVAITPGTLGCVEGGWGQLGPSCFYKMYEGLFGDAGVGARVSSHCKGRPSPPWTLPGSRQGCPSPGLHPA